MALSDLLHRFSAVLSSGQMLGFCRWRPCPRLVRQHVGLAPVVVAGVIATSPLSAAAEPEEMAWSWEQDNSGAITRVVGPGGVAVDIETRTQEAGDEIAVTQKLRYSDDVRMFGFDAVGRLRQAENASGKMVFKIDALGQPVEVLNSDRPALSYDWDVHGRLRTFEVAAQAWFSYRYDYLGRIARVDTPVGQITYAYHRASGTVTRELPNGIKTRRTYDEEGLLTEIVHVDTNNSVIARFRYRYRPDGLIGEIEEFTRAKGEQTCGLGYDIMERLTKVDCSPGEALAFAYDETSNLIGKRLTNDAPVRSASGTGGILQAHSDGAVKSDARGHVRALPGPDGAVAYAYDGAGQLSAANDVRYHYNALGLMVERSAADSSELYLPDPFADAWRPLWRKEAGGVESVFLWDGAVPLLEIRDGAAVFRLEDHLGSPRALVDLGGDVTSWPEYTPFGVPDGLNADDGPAPGFAGLFWDADPQVYLTAQRAYHPETGRFLQPDPVLRVPDASRFNHTLYAYAAGDPVNYVDRNGAEAVLVENETSGSAFDLSIAVTHRRGLDLQALLREYLKSTIDAGPEASPRYPTWNEFLANSIGRTGIQASHLPQTRVASRRDPWAAQARLLRMREKIQRSHERALANARRTVQFYSNLAEQVLTLKYKVLQMRALTVALEDYHASRVPQNLSKIKEISNIIYDRNYAIYRDANPMERQRKAISFAFSEMNILRGYPSLNERSTAADIDRIVDARLASATEREKRNVKNLLKYVYVEIGFGGLTVQGWQTTENMWYAADMPQQMKFGLGGLYARSFQFSYDYLYKLPLRLLGISSKLRWQPFGGDWVPPTPLRNQLVDVFTGIGIRAEDDPNVMRKFLKLDWNSKTYEKFQTPPVMQAPLPIIPNQRPMTSDLLSANPSAGPTANDIAQHLMQAIETARQVSMGRDLVGGDGRSAGRLAIANLDSQLAAQNFRDRMSAYRDAAAFSPALPSRVGGVYLGGAGAHLEGLDQIVGVAVDPATGRIVLVGQDGQSLDLPPLRLDDVVTIFRTVYDHGQAPSVTIDPMPGEPEGPRMLVGHGPGTSDSYVGWVLFHCDRVMKSYMLGEDNITRKPTITRAPGYEAMLKQKFSGAEDGSAWHRYWIVPAKVRLLSTAVQVSGRGVDPTAFDVPLRVKTQRMKWVGGELVDDTGTPASASAVAFSSWFTENLEIIAGEVELLPPQETGITEPVKIFRELSRMATITAIAEHLRDRGVPMPLWMRDHKVVSVPVDPDTPSLRVSRPDGHVTIFGGVNLAPADTDIETYAETEEPAADDEEAIEFVSLAKPQIEAIAEDLPRLAIGTGRADLLAPMVVAEIADLTATVLPGTQSHAVGANRIAETDLQIPMGRGRAVSLTRYHNSFFDPDRTLGRGWTLDLPRLIHDPVPIAHDGFKTEFTTIPRLTSPLGNMEARFDTKRHIEAFGAELRVDPDRPDILGFAHAESRLLKITTAQVLFRDGTVWHFDEDGWLVLTEAQGIAIRYIRDGAGGLHQIVGYLGGAVTAEITLDHDAAGRIVQATGKASPLLAGEGAAPIEAKYTYDAEGRLACVARHSGDGCTNAYRYDGGRLVATSRDGAEEVRFGYSPQGALLAVETEDGLKHISLRKGAHGPELSMTDPDGAEKEVWRYDHQMRPIAMERGSDHRTWTYPETGEVISTWSLGGDLIETKSVLPDGGVRIERAGQPVLEGRPQKGGRVVLLSDNAIAAEIARHLDGTLKNVTTGETQLTPRYDQDGLQIGILFSAPITGGRTDEWTGEDWDHLGRPVTIRDASGWLAEIGYDAAGRVASLGHPGKDGRLTGRAFDYDPTGRLAGIRSSWGDLAVTYQDNGLPAAMIHKKGGYQASVKFDAFGRPMLAKAFAGGETAWSYDQEANSADPTDITLANGLKITRRQGEDDAVTISIGTTSRDVRVSIEDEGSIRRYRWSE